VIRRTGYTASGRVACVCSAAAAIRPNCLSLGADAVFGETGFLTGETRDTDAVAVGDVQVEFLRRNEFLAILSVQPHLLSATFEPVFNLVRSASADMPDPDTSHAGHLESADIEDDDISPAEILSHGSAPDTLGIRLVLAGR